MVNSPSILEITDVPSLDVIVAPGNGSKYSSNTNPDSLFCAKSVKFTAQNNSRSTFLTIINSLITLIFAFLK